MHADSDTPHAPRHEEVFEAIKNGDARAVEALVDSDESLLNVADHNQSTPVTRAFAYGHLDLALSLVRRGANPFAMNHSDKWGMRYIVEKDGLSDDQRREFVYAVIDRSGRGNESGPPEHDGTRGLAHYGDAGSVFISRHLRRRVAARFGGGGVGPAT